MTRHATFEQAEAHGGHVLYDTMHCCYWTVRHESTAQLLSTRSRFYLADGWKEVPTEEGEQVSGIELTEAVGEGAQLASRGTSVWAVAVLIILAFLLGVGIGGQAK